MSIPTPRPAADTIDDRAFFLAACEHVYDHCRAASRAQLLHGASMIHRKLGGTLMLVAESVVTKRVVPEVGFVSEGMPIDRLGTRFS